MTNNRLNDSIALFTGFASEDPMMTRRTIIIAQVIQNFNQNVWHKQLSIK